MNRPSWINARRHDPSWLKASGIDASGGWFLPALGGAALGALGGVAATTHGTYAMLTPSQRAIMAQWLEANQRQGRTSVGSVGGEKSVAELIDYIAHVNALLALTKKTFDESGWFTKDPNAASQWITDFVAIQQRFDVAKASPVVRGILHTTLPIDIVRKQVPAQEAFNEVAHAVQQIPMHRTKGDLGDLVARLNRIKQVQEGSLPQPRQDIDRDLDHYRLSNAAVQALPWNTLPGAASSALATAEEAARDAANAVERAAKSAGLPTWEEAKPYVIAAGMLAGLATLASIVKSVRR